MKFLHISDIHLGCDLYHIENEERMRDYGRAWGECIQIAIDEKVDFVLIGGDLFDKKTPTPRAMIQAISGLTDLQNNNIPAIAIEGNHDNLSNGKQYSWLHTLCEMKLIKLLESDIKGGEDGKLNVRMNHWDEENTNGQFIDIGKARIFGTSWSGASISKFFPAIIEKIAENKRENAFNILMLHTELEGENISPFPLLQLAELNLAKPHIDYVALGHIHKHFVIENWAFNPGCLEITNISESKHQHGALLVEVNKENEISYRLLENYFRRPFHRVRVAVDGKIPEEVFNISLETVKRQVDLTKVQPIIELIFEGHLGFKTVELEVNKILDEVKKLTNALHVRANNKTQPRDLPIAVDFSNIDRKALEKQVLSDLVFRDTRYNSFAEDFADVAISVKEKALSDEDAEIIAEFIEEKIVARRNV
jgi:DNA repair exonuclease SbcCD nuclease subunit